MSVLRFDTGAALLQNVTADYMRVAGGPVNYAYANQAGGSASSSMPSDMASTLRQLISMLNEFLDTIEGEGADGAQGRPSNSGGGSGSNGANASVIAGEARIWGDPHFIGQDGGKYDVQGKAGRIYNLLSDRNFQMNGKFEQWGSSAGTTVVGEVGISAGTDQVRVDKDGTVMVNGRELKEGDRVELADGGMVHYRDGNVQIESGEWKTNIQFAGSGDRAHLNIDVSTDNAVADGVEPHGLLGQTFDADDDARNGDRGKGMQGGGAIEGLNGEITNRGDKSAVRNYEVSGLYDRNFEDFNRFFDDVESNPGANDDRLQELLGVALVSLAQSLMAVINYNQAALADA